MLCDSTALGGLGAIWAVASLLLAMDYAGT